MVTAENTGKDVDALVTRHFDAQQKGHLVDEAVDEGCGTDFRLSKLKRYNTPGCSRGASDILLNPSSRLW